MKLYPASRRLCRSVFAIVCLCAMTRAAVAEIQTDFLMDSDPQYPASEPIKDFDPRLTELWLQALDRPEIDMQRMAAETIARAHIHGVPDLHAAVPRLEEILLAKNSHPTARFAAARALIVLDSRDSADKLFEASQAHGTDLRQLVEPALAEWGNTAAQAVWMERLSAPDTRPRELILAMRGLADVREQAALPALLAIAGDPIRNAGLRLEAATAAGKIAESGLEQEAERFAENIGSPLFVDQLCAVRLLASHSSKEAQEQLAKFATHDEPAISSAALKRLNEIDPALVLPFAFSAIKNADPHVRRQGAICLLGLPKADHIRPLSRLLADPNPELRREVREGLYQWTENADLSDRIRDAALEVLAVDQWEGQEQAALLMGALEHRPAADRLLELQESPRPGVRVAAAWALRKLAIPETIPALIDQATRVADQGGSDELSRVDEQLAHLFEALGVLGAEPATPVLSRYIPKRGGFVHRTRGAAIWALGRIYAGKGNPELEEAFVGRIMDFAPRPSEMLIVKEMSAVALGRMKAVDAADMMRQFALSLNKEQRTDTERSVSTRRLHLALRWAVRELTGEELPSPRPLAVDAGNWFLEPLP